MRKTILKFFMISILLSFASCDGVSETAHFNNAGFEPDIVAIETFEENLQDAKPHDADTCDASMLSDELHLNDNISMATSPHPFATALKEYIADYDGIILAYLATLDDNGTIGVLATRPTTRELIDYDSGEYGYGFLGTLFYM